MNDKLFESPVFVKDGNFTILEIASLGDAIDFLNECPVELPDVPYETIRRACYSALDGSYPLNSARDNFAKWAKATNILEDVAAVPAVGDTAEIWPRRRSGLRQRKTRAVTLICNGGMSADIYPALLSGEEALALSAAISIGPTENSPALALSVSARR